MQKSSAAGRGCKRKNGELETIHNISGYTLRVKTVYMNGTPIAFLGMHPHAGGRQGFPAPHTDGGLFIGMYPAQRRLTKREAAQR